MDSMKADRRIELIGGILLYGKQDQSIDYATLHDALEGPDGFQLGAGEALSADGLGKIAERLSGRQNSGFLHERMLSWGTNSMAWWLPAGHRAVFFNTKDSELRDRSGCVPCPTLIFACAKGRWFVGALKGSQRPKAHDRVFHSPFLNVYEGGAICTGTAKVPKSASSDSIEEWESAFFSSRFTHSNFRMEKQIDYPQGIMQFWVDMLDGKFSEFPEDLLMPMDMTVSEFVSGED